MMDADLDFTKFERAYIALHDGASRRQFVDDMEDISISVYEMTHPLD
jgi:hypothetical protein